MNFIFDYNFRNEFHLVKVSMSLQCQQFIDYFIHWIIIILFYFIIFARYMKIITFSILPL